MKIAFIGTCKAYEKAGKPNNLTNVTFLKKYAGSNWYFCPTADQSIRRRGKVDGMGIGIVFCFFTVLIRNDAIKTEANQGNAGTDGIGINARRFTIDAPENDLAPALCITLASGWNASFPSIQLHRSG